MDYIISGTDIRHNGEYYPEGSTISLEEPYATRLSGFLTPAAPADSLPADDAEVVETGNVPAGSESVSSKKTPAVRRSN